MNKETYLETLAQVDETIKTYKDYPIDDVVYYDLNPVYQNPTLRANLVKICMAELSAAIHKGTPLLSNIDYIACVESRGFIIGSILANIYNKGIVLLRSKKGRLPGKTAKVKHKLEYGNATMEVQKGKGNILIFDDVVATGGTANAAVKVLKKGGYTPLYSLFLLELAYCKPKLTIDNKSILTYEE